MNPTNDPQLRSFIAVPPASHFPIQNLPFGVFSPTAGGAPRVGVAIGDQTLDLGGLEARGFFRDVPGFGGDGGSETVFNQPALNAFLALGQPAWRRVREIVSQLLRADTPTLRDDPALRAEVLLPRSETRMHLPARVGDYTDFYSSRDHATNVGTMLRGAENALMPNWLHLPVAYHGRSSSLVVSGTPVRRPLGQTKPPNTDAPVFGPSKSLDFELEVGVLVGPGNRMGEPVSVDRAAEHLFGLVLVNDWSARDIQAWEYQPLGPFLAKNFATTLSPWVVTAEALAPFRTTWQRADGDPQPLPYLDAPAVRSEGAFDIQLEARLSTSTSDAAHEPPMRLTQTSFRHAYWTVGQMVTHHTVNGCRLMPGDLFGSGTSSGPTSDEAGALIELVEGGKKPFTLPNGETRTFLEDGDTVVFRGWCEKPGARRIGFGECRGTVLPAR